MAYTPIYERQFKKDVEKALKWGKDLEKIATLLIGNVSLPIKNRNHKLKGDYSHYWECHIEPDWLLIYKRTDTEIIFARMGTHADLFE